jgi:Zn-dependent protease
MTSVLLVGVLIVSVVLHEVSHGAVAARLGDPTARLAGRLTLNPLKHLDPVGSVLLPVVLVVTGAPFVFGWAKPVPYDPRYFRSPRWGAALVGAAGPAMNMLLALAAGLAIRSGAVDGPLVYAVVVVNLVLAVFNLLPVPPLDGSKLLYPVLPIPALRAYLSLERFGILIAVGLVYLLGGHILSPPVRMLFRIITGAG